MLSIIKWEFIKTLRRLWGILLFQACVIAVSAIVPVGLFRTSDHGTDIIAFILSFCLIFTIPILMFYPMYNMICDFRKKSYALERSSGVEMWKSILAKSIVNLAVALIAVGVMFLAITVFQRFNTESTKYFSVFPSERIPKGWIFPVFLIEAAIVYPAQILFGYIMASTGRIFRNHRIIGTVLWLAVFNYVTIWIWSTGNYLLPELIMALLLFTVAARRADRRYEQFVGNM